MDLAQDNDGSIVFGWIAKGIYFARFVGHLSVTLGEPHLVSLERAAASAPHLRYFCDSSQLTSYDLLARSGFVRVLLNHRKKFRDIVILNWAGGVSQEARMLAETVRQPLFLLDNRADFEARLTAAAPHHSLVLRMSPEATPRQPSSPQAPARARR